MGKCILSQRLKEAGMTQKQLADKLCISKQAVNAYCNNRKTLPLKRAFEIANILEISVEDLFEPRESSE